MMHNSDNFYFGGMHMFWWLFLIVIVVALGIWFARSRTKR